jgi:hypothetical protein
LVLAILAGVAGLFSTYLTYILRDNLSCAIHRLFGQDPGQQPAAKPKWLWSVYGISLLVFIVVGAYATAAPDLPSEPKDINVSTPVKVGDYAQVSLKTDPGAHCELSYITPKGNLSEADGLGAILADGNGICAWKWQIYPRTNPGMGTLSIVVEETKQVLEIEIIR